MRAKQFTRRVNEGVGDGEVANAVVAEVIKLIGEGHTEVSPDVITTKVSAALGRPFMLKDLVAANNGSPELQHYIDSINPSKIKFSTDILTVKNQDPVKEKERSQAGVSSMASRAASRPRLGEGWGADAANARHAEQQAEWDKTLEKHKDDPKMTSRLKHLRAWKASEAEKAAHAGEYVVRGRGHKFPGEDDVNESVDAIRKLSGLK